MNDRACPECSNTNSGTSFVSNQQRLYAFLGFIFIFVNLLLVYQIAPMVLPSVSVWRLTFGDFHPMSDLGSVGTWIVHESWVFAIVLAACIIGAVQFVRRVLLVPYRGWVCGNCRAEFRVGGGGRLIRLRTGTPAGSVALSDPQDRSPHDFP